MLHPDPRAYRVALVADAVANDGAASFDALGLLDAASWGIIVPPPSDFSLNRVGSLVEYVVDDLVDYARNGYSVVVVGTSAVEQFGVWDSHVGAEIARRGLEPFERFDVAGATAEQFATFLAERVPAAER